jgi:Uma2 family endonuclease
MGVKELKHYTYDEFIKLNNDETKRMELIFGQIYMMAGASAIHQKIVGNIFFHLRSKNITTCDLMIAPFDIKLRVDNQINVVQPDVMMFCEEDLCGVFEVLSKSTAYKDKKIKKRLYKQAKIKEYFIIDGNNKIVEKFTLVGNEYKLEVFGEDDEMEIKCLNITLKVNLFFEGIKD